MFVVRVENIDLIFMFYYGVILMLCVFVRHLFRVPIVVICWNVK